MATLVLQTAGAAIGGALGGPIGAALGRAIGGVAGYAVDQQLFTKDKVVNGPRLATSRIMASQSGAPVPRSYGRTQIGGQIIWATRFQEVVTQSSQGGKGAPKTTVNDYAYFGNFAIGVCEGPVNRIGRIWADGNELDQTQLQIRTYLGNDDQQPDPLIEALQGAGNTPAYRGFCYLVLEDFPLATYGNRIPQISVEVVRSVDPLENDIRSVCIIPGSTAFGYSPEKKANYHSEGQTYVHNRHNLIAQSDWTASMDELQAICPNLKSVSLVVTWFGTDLRADQCQIVPGVENRQIASDEQTWKVLDSTPQNAHLISKVNQRPAFGSTPTDQSIIEAIADLKARGLKVTFYPFIMMDIPSDNQLASPYSNPTQPAYPWRGRITCNPAIGQPNSADQTALAQSQIESFFGNAVPTDFQSSSSAVDFIGNPQASFSKMILHYAHLTQLAGGVDHFLIGSEMVGLTTVRDHIGQFPFANKLKTLAGYCRQIVNNNCKISYAADWSEYFGYQPNDGSGDRYFHLDGLWSDENIDAVGIDNYMPLSDWQATGDPENESFDPYSVASLSTQIAGGEGYDWYYASESDRSMGIRTPITDGLGEPWIWRFKDLISWWANPHHERISGTRRSTPTRWSPQSKPIWFTELGCPAIDRGANQPNVFFDEKSAQSALPYFSNGSRDDLIQRRFIQSHLNYWSPDHPDATQRNPISSVYQGPMVENDQISLWAWDARPYPAFPNQLSIWSDGSNWQLGHWLNGRLGTCSLEGLIAAILRDYGYYGYDVSRLSGWLEGFVIGQTTSARKLIDELLALYGATATMSGDTLKFSTLKRSSSQSIDVDDFVDADTSRYTLHHAQETDLPKEAIVYHSVCTNKVEETASHSRQLPGHNSRQVQFQLPIILPASVGVQLADARLHDAWAGNTTLRFSLPTNQLEIECGDVVSFNDIRLAGLWQVVEMDEAETLQLELRKVSFHEQSAQSALQIPEQSGTLADYGRPLALLMDIAFIPSTIDQLPRLTTALFADPWASSYLFASSQTDSNYKSRKLSSKQARIGKLVQALPAGPEGRWDYANHIFVQMINGSPSSVDKLSVLSGDNILCIQNDSGGWEIIQFQHAQLMENGKWKLSSLLRAQQGTEYEMNVGNTAQNYVVFLDGQTDSIELGQELRNLPLNWRVGPALYQVADSRYQSQNLICSDRSSKCLSPVHIQAKMNANGDISLSWIRRSRIAGDDWEAVEIPLGEPHESYQIDIVSNNQVVRSIQRTDTTAIYTYGQQLADLAAFPSDVEFRIAQLNRYLEPGGSRSLHMNIRH